MILKNQNSRTFKTVFHQTPKLSRHNLVFKDFSRAEKMVNFLATFKDLWLPW